MFFNPTVICPFQVFYFYFWTPQIYIKHMQRGVASSLETGLFQLVNGLSRVSWSPFRSFFFFLIGYKRNFIWEHQTPEPQLTSRCATVQQIHTDLQPCHVASQANHPATPLSSDHTVTVLCFLCRASALVPFAAHQRQKPHTRELAAVWASQGQRVCTANRVASSPAEQAPLSGTSHPTGWRSHIPERLWSPWLKWRRQLCPAALTLAVGL